MRSLRWRKCGLLTLALNQTTQQHCFRKTEGRVSHPTFHDAWRGSGSSVSLVCLVCVGGRTRETWQTRTRDKLRWSRRPLICHGRFCRDGRSSVASLVISGLDRQPDSGPILHGQRWCAARSSVSDMGDPLTSFWPEGSFQMPWRLPGRPFQHSSPGSPSAFPRSWLATPTPFSTTQPDPQLRCLLDTRR